jgi:hypothetical protein
MFEGGDRVEVLLPVCAYPFPDFVKTLIFKPGDVAQIKRKHPFREGYVVYSDVVKTDIILYNHEIKKLNKNNVTIVMRK